MRESGSETCRFLLQEHYWASNICITGSWLEVQNLGLPWWSSGKDSVLPFQWRRLIPGQGTKIPHAVCAPPPQNAESLHIRPTEAESSDNSYAH